MGLLPSMGTVKTIVWALVALAVANRIMVVRDLINP
jgi:hypothetical protein